LEKAASSVGNRAAKRTSVANLVYFPSRILTGLWQLGHGPIVHPSISTVAPTAIDMTIPAGRLSFNPLYQKKRRHCWFEQKAGNVVAFIAGLRDFFCSLGFALWRFVLVIFLRLVGRPDVRLVFRLAIPNETKKTSGHVPSALAYGPAYLKCRQRTGHLARVD